MAYKQGGVLNPNQTIRLVDDFISNGNDNPYGELSWRGTGTFTVNVQATASNPGTIECVINSGDSYGGSALNLTNDKEGIILGAGKIVLEYIVKIVNLSSGSTNRYNLLFGLQDNNSAPPGSGIYFIYSDNVNSGNWQLQAISASTSTTNTSIPAATDGFHRFTIIIDSTGTSAEGFIDGVSVGTVSSNLPTSSIGPVFAIGNTGSVTTDSASVSLDQFNMTINLTTSR